MRKNIFLISIIFSVLGAVNLILFAILSSLGLVFYRSLSYVFAVGFIASVWVPMVLNLLFKTKFNVVLLVSYNLFMIASISLGSLWNLYAYVSGFDKVVHFLSGILFALLAYDLLKNSKQNNLSYFWMFFVCFSISMMCGGVWEIYEFVADGLFSNNAQGAIGQVGRAAIADSMLDLVCDFVGAVLGGLITVLFEKRAKRTEILKENENVAETN